MTLFRLSQEQARHADEPPAPDKTGERALTRIANRLSELIDQVGQVGIDRDDKRELSTMLLTDRYRTELPAKVLSNGTLRFLALASAELDPTLTGLICMEEPENGIHPERIRAMIELLRDIAVDPELPTGDDNPLRQVIINTHSPVVVSQVPDDTLVFAVPEQQVVEGSVIKGVSFRSLSETWRTKTTSMAAIAKGKALAFLQPIPEKGNPKRKGANRRVMDREALQLGRAFSIKKLPNNINRLRSTRR